MSDETKKQVPSVSRDMIGERIRRARQDLGMSLEDMSRALKSLPEEERPDYDSAKTIQRWETAELSPPAAYLAYLVRQTGRRAEWFLFGGEMPKGLPEMKLEVIRRVLDVKSPSEESAAELERLLRLLEIGHRTPASNTHGRGG